MDKQIVETKTEKQVVKTEQNVKTEENITVQSAPPARSSYLNSFENMTVADIKREEERKKDEEFRAERDRYIQEQYEKEREQKSKKEQTKVERQEKLTEEKPSENIIEKPNYDLIQENKKIIKLTKSSKTKSKKSKKAGIALACALGASAIICVTNIVIIDQLSASYVQIDETYQFNLAKYLKDISNLDSTQKSMELIETYPEEILDAGDVGQSSNWFDRICNFIAGLFGG